MNYCNYTKRVLMAGLALVLGLQLSAQSRTNLLIHQSDGTVVRYDISQLDSLTFEDIPKWADRSESARRLLTYLDEQQGESILSGVHASVDYNTYEADWVYSHTGKYPAINCFDFIHDIYSGPDSWINYASAATWKNWTNKRGIVAAMWHWGMPTNDGSSYTCTPGTEDGQTSFHPSGILDPESEDYKTMIERIDQVAEYMKPMATAGVPIIWRPLHEAQGNWTEKEPGTSWHHAWFWWGIDGPEAFVALWRVMYDRMVNYHGLTNLVWVFTAGDSKRWYPGDEYVDIVGYDFYNKSTAEMRKVYEYFQKTYPDKLYAISEFGNIAPLSEFWADGQYWSFMIPWWDNSVTSKPGSDAFKSTEHKNANVDYWTDMLNQSCIITRDKLPNFR